MSNEQAPGPESFGGKVVWITGASSGIGEALARNFAGHGARLVLSARREAELQRVMSQCLLDGARAEDLLVLPLDIVDYEAMPAAVAAVLNTFSRIDLLINNAGISQRSFCLETDMAVYRRLFEVDVLGQKRIGEVLQKDRAEKHWLDQVEGVHAFLSLIHISEPTRPY